MPDAVTDAVTGVPQSHCLLTTVLKFSVTAKLMDGEKKCVKKINNSAY